MLYIGVSFALIAAALVLVKLFVKSQRTKNIIYWVTAGVLFALIWANRISTMILQTVPEPLGWRNLIPSSFCHLTSLLLMIGVVFLRNKNHWFFHSFLFVSILGAILTAMVPAALVAGDPNYAGGNVFELRSIFSQLYHTVTLFLALMLIVMGDFKPDFKKLWILGLGYAVMVMYFLFVIQVVGIPNAAGLEYPLLAGSIFYWWAVAGLYTLILLSILVPVQVTLRVKANRRALGVIKDTPLEAIATPEDAKSTPPKTAPNMPKNAPQPPKKRTSDPQKSTPKAPKSTPT